MHLVMRYYIIVCGVGKRAFPDIVKARRGRTDGGPESKDAVCKAGVQPQRIAFLDMLVAVEQSVTKRCHHDD